VVPKWSKPQPRELIETFSVYVLAARSLAVVGWWRLAGVVLLAAGLVLAAGLLLLLVHLAAEVSLISHRLLPTSFGLASLFVLTPLNLSGKCIVSV
jgi:hypothetical protein